ncbi:hypothetical protein BDP67DRAFT_520873 [Colletotrichum lupini]|nr:hypothetical protein BDP67DRAFT_520873 [Colletotrichum lupini]
MADPNTHPWGHYCGNSTDSSANGTIDIWKPVCGWVSAGNDRGTIDILWSSNLTIFLCVWVATHPNALGHGEKWWHAAIDKFNLAAIGLLGPDFLFGIAVGQLASARKSVKEFKKLPKRIRGEKKWTLKHAFFVDMGGIHLKSPDYGRFPINAAQLLYLIKDEYVVYPDMEAMAISERNSVDALSRIITVWQAILFCIKEGDRLRLGLPITPLELTALSFTFVMFSTSICWFYKPTITCPQDIETETAIEFIRKKARQTTHPDLPHEWFQTPLAFVSRQEFRIATHWSYYTRLCDMMHLHLFVRPMDTSPTVFRPYIKRPWSRIPSDIWMPIGLSLWIPSIFVMALFSCSFMFGWNFFFPSETERKLWRVCATYHMIFSLYGGIYYSFEVWRSYRRLKYSKALPLSIAIEDPESQRHQSQSNDKEYAALPTCTSIATEDARSQRHQIHSSSAPNIKLHVQAKAWGRSAHIWIGKWRNISPDQNPDMAVPLRVVIPTTIFCALYVFCRAYFYLEDSLSLRVQPQGTYMTGDKILPFIATPVL